MTLIEEVADRILRDAVENNVSDIHIIPRKEDAHVQFRYTHRLVPKLTFSLDECERLISHFKFTASMDIGERRRPQNGAYTIYIDKQQIGLRLSTLPGNKKESLVIRLLPQQEYIPFYRLSLFPHMSTKLLSLLKYAHGMVIFTGPTLNVR